MVKKQTRCKNQIKSILSFYGIHIPDDFTNGYWSKRFINWIESVRMERASGNLCTQDALWMSLSIIRHHHCRDEPRRSATLANTDDYRNNVRILKTVPGISTLTAMTLLTELYDINRFKTLDKLCSYVGLIPNTIPAGKQDRQNRHHQQAERPTPSHLDRKRLDAVRKDPALMMAFNELCKHMTKTKAIVRIARKLLNRIRYVLKNQQEYVPAVVQ